MFCSVCVRPHLLHTPQCALDDSPASNDSLSSPCSAFLRLLHAFPLTDSLPKPFTVNVVPAWMKTLRESREYSAVRLDEWDHGLSRKKMDGRGAFSATKRTLDCCIHIGIFLEPGNQHACWGSNIRS